MFLAAERFLEVLASAFGRRCGPWSGLVVALSLIAPSAPAIAGGRLGLVIGEANYKAGALQTPANDAGAVAQALASAGFDVTGYADLDTDGTRRAFDAFLDKARQAGPDAVVFVYLAGYGLQFDGDDFLVPIDARITRDVDIPKQAVRLTDLSRNLSLTDLKARIVVYDLARPHPFGRDGAPLAAGLAGVEPPPGAVVAFNTAPGLVAGPDGGDYGLYAEALTEMMQTKGLSISTLFTRLRKRVVALSNGSVVPWAEGSVDPSLSLFPPVAESTSLLAPLKSLVTGGSAAESFWTAIGRDSWQGYRDALKAYPADPASPRLGALLAVRREETIWAQVRRANTAAAYWTYLRLYPRGPHFADTRRFLAAVPAALEPPPRFEAVPFTDPPAPKPDELAFINHPLVLAEHEADGALPIMPGADLPSLRPEFYDRACPLLPVVAGSLPLPLPIALGFEGEAGRITQPGSDPRGAPVIAAAGSEPGATSVTQMTGDARVLSVARVSVATGGGRTTVQSGPENRPVATTTTVEGAGGGRTITQTAADGRVLCKAVTVVEPSGLRVTTLSGRAAGPSTVTTTATRTLVQTHAVQPAAAQDSPRPVIVAAPPPPVVVRPTGAGAPPPPAETHPAAPVTRAVEIPAGALQPVAGAAEGLAAHPLAPEKATQAKAALLGFAAPGGVYLPLTSAPPSAPAPAVSSSPPSAEAAASKPPAPPVQARRQDEPTPPRRPRPDLVKTASAKASPAKAGPAKAGSAKAKMAKGKKPALKTVPRKPAPRQKRMR